VHTEVVFPPHLLDGNCESWVVIDMKEGKMDRYEGRQAGRKEVRKKVTKEGYEGREDMKE
jgi:hypothetical protein